MRNPRPKTKSKTSRHAKPIGQLHAWWRLLLKNLFNRELSDFAFRRGGLGQTKSEKLN
jgi:hypothetical protein